MVVRKVTKSVGFPTDMLDEVEWLIDEKNPKRKVWNFSEAIIKLVGVGIILVRQEGKIESQELVEKLNGLISDEKIMDWLRNLSSSQRIGLKQMIDMIDEAQQTRL